ncbi:class IV adenylate cyclase [Streptomyces blattellae]|uniref:class IV adenylate cyclase n=1 Tax=Streptomyces blattellae TaxID=2569855 RepID=UPI0012B6E3F0|nr:class IV adenylate cyclase [Streptomyces blattellae]
MTAVDGQIEVERKRELADGGEALARLLTGLSWTPDASVMEVDTYYTRPDVDFMKTVECLRVRRRDDFSEITYKPPSTPATHSTDSVISKPETNVHLVPDHAERADQLLENIGMRRLVRVEKHRTTYRHPAHPGVSVSIDMVAGVGAFVETEVISRDAAAAARTVADTERRLGVADLPVVDLPYRDLALSHTPA